MEAKREPPALEPDGITELKRMVAHAMSYQTELHILVGSYSIPSPWAGMPTGHGAGISSRTSTSTSADTGSGVTWREDGPAHYEVNPSFLVQDHEQGRVWAVSEQEHSGELLCFDLDARRQLITPVTRTVSTQSAGPCHVELHREVALVSHFHGGTVSVIPRDKNGLPIEVTELIRTPAKGDGWNRSARASHPHAAKFVPGSSSFVVADFGRDLVLLYEFRGVGSAAALVDVAALEPDTGPRHLAWHAESGCFLVSNQTVGGVTVLRVTRDAQGEPAALEHLQTAPGGGLRRAQPVPSEIAIHPDGRRAILANRADNSLTVYGIAANGSLTELCSVDSGGLNPRHFAISPDGALVIVAHQESDELVVFEWRDGRPVEASRAPLATPTSVLFTRG